MVLPEGQTARLQMSASEAQGWKLLHYGPAAFATEVRP